jgi:hypothetical protein
MANAYVRSAPRKRKRKRERHPELPLAAEMAGVTYWMAYRVKRGEAKSRKVAEALAMARKDLASRRRRGKRS